MYPNYRYILYTTQTFEMNMSGIIEPLQNINNFYTYKYIFAGQKPSYSDIEKKCVNYNIIYK